MGFGAGGGGGGGLSARGAVRGGMLNRLIPSNTVLLQEPTDREQVLHNMHSARESGKHIILNPAPAQLLPDFA